MAGGVSEAVLTILSVTIVALGERETERGGGAGEMDGSALYSI